MFGQRWHKVTIFSRITVSFSVYIFIIFPTGVVQHIFVTEMVEWSFYISCRCFFTDGSNVGDVGCRKGSGSCQKETVFLSLEFFMITVEGKNWYL